MIRRKVLICRRRGPILRTQAVPVYRPPKARKERIVELPEDIEAPTKENDPETNWDTSPKACRRRLEATLVMARGPLTSRKLAQLAILEDGTQARTIILALNEHYDRVGRAFHIKRVAGGYQMLTRPQFSNWISRLEHIPKKPRLSRPAMETLTIVAYRQPIIRADIEAIRGASCGEMLRQLLERGLVKIAGRSPELGRPFLYATTKEFLTCFGFNTIKNIPRAKQLAGKGLPEWASSSDNFTDNPQSTSSVEESSDV